MGVFKEEAHTFETIAKKQVQIYNDAADYGYPYNRLNPPSEITAVFKAIDSFKKLDKEFPDEKNLIRNRTNWGLGVTIDVIIFWERDEGHDCGTKYTITYQETDTHSSRIDKKSNSFISIDVERYVEKT